MKGKKTELVIVLSLTAILLGVLAFLPLMSAGDRSPSCCPEIVEFKTPYEYINPNVHVVKIWLFYRLFYATQEGKPCEPYAIPSEVIKIKNMTKGSDRSEMIFPKMFMNKFRCPSLGVYENYPGGLGVVVKKDSSGNYKDEYKIQLVAKGDHEDCQGDSRQVTVKIVKTGTVADICCKYEPELGFWIGNIKAEPGIIIKSIENPTPQPNSAENSSVIINIRYDGTQHKNLKPGDKSDVFNGLNPNNNWIIDIPDKREHERYVKTNAPLCVKAQLMCVSP